MQQPTTKAVRQALRHAAVPEHVPMIWEAGAYYLERPKTELRRLAQSSLLWDRRIAIVMFRYALERLDASLRKRFMAAKMKGS